MRHRPILFLASAALVIILWPALTGDAVLGYRDMLHNYGPMRELFWSGRISFWNDRAFGGSSVLADIVQQPFYLGNLVMRALHAPAWPGIPIRIALHTVGGMMGMWALMRRFTDDAAAGLGAVSFGLCGFSLANLGSNPQWACAQSWMPVALLAFDVWAERGGLVATAFAAVSLPQILLAGDPHLFGMTVAVCVALAWLRRKRPAGELLLEGAAIAVGIGVVVLPQVVAALRSLGDISRGAGLPRDIREQWSLHPARIPELFVPRMYGPLFSDGFWGSFTVSPPWHRNYVHSIYAGLVGPALAWLALRRRWREAAPWAALGLAGLLLALGAYFFHFYGVLGEVLPLMRVFRYPQRFVAVVMPAWAALLALGAGELKALSRPRRAALAGGAALLAFACLAVAALAVKADPASVRTTALQIALVGAASCAAALLPGDLAATALAAVLVFDLAAANGELVGILPRGPIRAPPAACDALDDASHHAQRFRFRVFVDNEALDSPRFSDWVKRRIREYNYGKRNLVEVCGYREAVALSSLDPKDELSLWRAVGQQRTLSVMGTRFVVTAPGRAGVFGGKEVVVDPLWNFAVVEVPAAPVLFRPERVEQVPAALLIDEARRRPDLLGDQIAALDAAPSEHVADPGAKLVAWTTFGDEVFFRVRQSQPGYWVLAATLDRDWQGEVDGAPAPIVGSDLVRRAVWVPAGDHVVSLFYRPTLQFWLFALSALTTAWLSWVTVRGALQWRHGPIEDSDSR